MMPTGWDFFPWPVFFIVPMMAMTVFIALRLSRHRGAMGPGCGFVAPRGTTMGVAAAPLAEDQMVVLRERFARGEIGIQEFEDRLEGLLRTETEQSNPGLDRSTGSVPLRSPK